MPEIVDWYNGNPQVKRDGVITQFTQEQVNEYIKCSQDPAYFARKYCKVINLDRGLVPFDLYPYQEKMFDHFNDNRFSIVLACRQSGKDQPLNTKIPTPTGWSTIGDLQIGDQVIGDDGLPTTVIDKSPIFNDKIIYKITFDTGETVKASSTHLWDIKHNSWTRYNKSARTITTQEIYDKFHSGSKTYSNGRMFIDAARPVELPERNLPIDPYTLGVWLGDGSRRVGCVYGVESDLKEIISYIPLSNTGLRDCNTAKVVTITGLTTLLREHNIQNNKHIPHNYLRSSINQRLELLRGLMDTDGSVVRASGACEFYQKDRDIIDQFRELLSSLGIKSYLSYKTITDQKYWTVRFSTSLDVFKLKRKLHIQQTKRKNHPKATRHYITNVEQVESVPTQCISVNNDSHLYLCGDNWVPTHNSISSVAYLLWYAIFHSEKTVAILANKGATAREMLSRVTLMLENLPFWLQPGCKSLNKGSIEFSNNSTIMAGSTSASSIRGFSVNLLYLDEFAFVEDAATFYTSTYPVVSSGKDTKVIITSTANGIGNTYHKIWEGAVQRTNQYKPFRVDWWDVPGRDEEWKKQTIENTSQLQFDQEFGNTFFGTGDTLIDSRVLIDLRAVEPIALRENNCLSVYKEPVKDNDYLMMVDVSKGRGQDYSTFNIINVTSKPFEQVAVYRNNTISPLLFPDIIHKYARLYNNAYVIVESNDQGSIVCNALYHDIEYENIHLESVIKSDRIGIEVNKKVKRIGCSAIKDIIESHKLKIVDEETIREMSTFIAKGQSYEASDNNHDDLMMNLVLFGYFVLGDDFMNMTGVGCC